MLTLKHVHGYIKLYTCGDIYPACNFAA